MMKRKRLEQLNSLLPSWYGITPTFNILLVPVSSRSRARGMLYLMDERLDQAQDSSSTGKVGATDLSPLVLPPLLPFPLWVWEWEAKGGFSFLVRFCNCTRVLCGCTLSPNNPVLKLRLQPANLGELLNAKAKSQTKGLPHALSRARESRDASFCFRLKGGKQPPLPLTHGRKDGFVCFLTLGFMRNRNGVSRSVWSTDTGSLGFQEREHQMVSRSSLWAESDTLPLHPPLPACPQGD